MKKTNQQSRSSWGGRRKGAGAPPGNTNAVKHGERSRRACFAIGENEEYEASITPLTAMRIRNLLLAEHLGYMILEGRSFSGKPDDWREMMLIEGMMGQHTDRIIRLERRKSRAAAALERAWLATGNRKR